MDSVFNPEILTFRRTMGSYGVMIDARIGHELAVYNKTMGKQEQGSEIKDRYIPSEK
ncbi:MAG: hypothetical protein V1870_00075 [Candidatus Aenigmatarchaeota archaeon]